MIHWKKYKKRCLVIDAIKWDGKKSTFKVIKQMDKDNNIELIDNKLKIHTLEGVLYCDKGAYIIRGIKGEFYPVRNDIFDETYVEYDNHIRERLINELNDITHMYCIPIHNRHSILGIIADRILKLFND